MEGVPTQGGNGGIVSPRKARRLPAGLLAAVLTLFSAVPTLAQDDSRPFQFRSFLGLAGEYNDNFFLTEKNKQSEYREILTPGFSLRFSTGRSYAELSYAPSLVHSSLDEGKVGTVFQLFDTNGSLALAERLTLRASDHFVRTDDPAVTDPRSTQRGRSILIGNTFTSDLTYKQETWSLTPRYALTFNQTEGENQGAATQVGNQTNDRGTVHTLGIDGTLDILGRNTLGAGYELAIGEFKVADDFVGQLVRLSFSRELTALTTASVEGSFAHRNVQGGSNYNIYRANIGVRREVSALYTSEVRVGYGVFDIAGGGTATTGEPEYLLKGTYTGRVVRLTLSSGQSIQESFLEAENVGVTKTTWNDLEIRYEPTDRLALTLRGRYSQNRFLQTTPFTIVGQQQERKDTYYNAGLDVAFKLTRLLSLTLGYTYVNVDSNIPGNGYQNNVIRLGLTATYE